MSEGGDFIKPPIRLAILEDQFPFVRTQMADRHMIRQNTASLHIKHFQGRDRRKQRIVPAARAERECLKESAGKLADVSSCSAASTSGEALALSTIASRPGLICSSRCQPTCRFT